jgi:glycosyltransferase involved in cell wall biosynthesis
VRVGWVIDSATYGGAEACVVQLARGLPELRGTAHCTTPVPPRLVRDLLAAGAAVELGPLSLGPLGLGPPADLLHVNMTDPATCGPALAAAVATGVPTVADVHMVGVTDPALTPAYRGCAAVVARSRPVATLLAGAHGVDPVVVRNGVRVGPAAGPGRDPLHLVAVGRLTRQKGHDLLLRAVRDLPVRVTIAGEGRDEAALRAAAAGLPVTFAGHVEDVPALLAGADLFCLPSRAEALPLALLEAVVAGLPCVAADVGDIAAELGDLVELVPPDDPAALRAALAGLVADPERRAELGARAREEGVRRFGEADTVAAVRAVYASASPA